MATPTVPKGGQITTHLPRSSAMIDLHHNFLPSETPSQQHINRVDSAQDLKSIDYSPRTQSMIPRHRDRAGSVVSPIDSLLYAEIESDQEFHHRSEEFYSRYVACAVVYNIDDEMLRTYKYGDDHYKSWKCPPRRRTKRTCWNFTSPLQQVMNAASFSFLDDWNTPLVNWADDEPTDIDLARWARNDAARHSVVETMCHDTVRLQTHKTVVEDKSEEEESYDYEVVFSSIENDRPEEIQVKTQGTIVEELVREQRRTIVPPALIDNLNELCLPGLLEISNDDQTASADLQTLRLRSGDGELVECVAALEDDSTEAWDCTAERMVCGGSVDSETDTAENVDLRGVLSIEHSLDQQRRVSTEHDLDALGICSIASQTTDGIPVASTRKSKQDQHETIHHGGENEVLKQRLDPVEDDLEIEQLANKDLEDEYLKSFCKTQSSTRVLVDKTPTTPNSELDLVHMQTEMADVIAISYSTSSIPNASCFSTDEGARQRPSVIGEAAIAYDCGKDLAPVDLYNLLRPSAPVLRQRHAGVVDKTTAESLGTHQTYNIDRLDKDWRQTDSTRSGRRKLKKRQPSPEAPDKKSCLRFVIDRLAAALQGGAKATEQSIGVKKTTKSRVKAGWIKLQQRLS